MPDAYVPTFLFAIAALMLAVGLLLLSRLFNPGRPGRVIRMPYESGMDPIHDTRRRFDVRFHLLAIAFLVFDVELLFLYPWAAAVSQGRSEGRGARDETSTVQSLVDPDRTSDGLPSPKSSLEPLPSTLSPLPASLVPRPGIDAAVAAGWVESRHLVFGGAMAFLALLTLGFIYDWRKGIFRWR